MAMFQRQGGNAYRGLKSVLQVKIIATAVFLCAPLLCLPAATFVRWGVPAPEPMLFVRLLGAAYLALLFAYYGGLQSIRVYQYPRQVVLMGLVSNGLGAAILLFYGASGAWREWGMAAQVYAWGLVLGALLMTVVLCLVVRAERLRE